MNGKNLNLIDATIFLILFSTGFLGIFIFYLQTHGYPVSLSVPVGLGLILVQIFWASRQLSFPQSKWGKILLIFLVYLAVRSFFIPLSGWDTYSLYDARAKMFLQGINYSDLSTYSKYDTVNLFYYFSYPPMTSNLHLWVYMLGLKSPMVIYAMFYIAYISVVTYWVIKFKLPTYLQLVIIVACLFHPLIYKHIIAGYTNLPMMAFQVGSIHYLLKYFNEKKLIYVIPFTLMLMFSVWTRITEPMFIPFVIAWSVIIFKDKLKLFQKIIFSLIPLLSVLWLREVWIGYTSSLVGPEAQGTLNISLNSKLFDALLLGNLLKVFQHLLYALSPIFLILLIPIVLITLAYLFHKPNPRLSFNPLFLVWLGVIIVDFAGTVYVSAYYDWWNKIPDSLLRSSLILIPVSILYFVTIYSDNRDKIT